MAPPLAALGVMSDNSKNKRYLLKLQGVLSRPSHPMRFIVCSIPCLEGHKCHFLCPLTVTLMKQFNVYIQQVALKSDNSFLSSHQNSNKH